ncbi:hypothetical protein OTU49_015117, partial [Cherax quadricarinatus]
IFTMGIHPSSLIFLTSLQYFQVVTACHEPTHNCSLSSETRLCALCSLHPAKIVETTTKLSEGSMISGLRIVNQTRSEVVVTWSVPADPNGQIIAFILTLQPNSVHVHWSPHQVSDHQRCVSSQFFKENNNTYVLNVTLMDPSQYWLSVQAYTRDADFSNDLSQKVSFSIEDKDDKAHNITLWAILPTVLVLLLVSATIVIIKIKARKEPIKETINPQYLHDTGLPLWTPDAYATISSQHILDCSDLLLEKSCQLGKGNFGIVMKGQLRLESGLIPVAVKQVTDYQAREDILQEAKLMLKLKCYHLVHAYGVVPGPNHMLLVMELMSRGDLLNYLRSLKAQDNDIFSVLSVDHVCAMAIQIADGMAYLASHKIVHRDLAARNCLVDDQLNIKISDFGMTRLTDNDYYKIRETKYFPVRWLPPEYLISSKFTSKSDVWSYGIVLWEILSGGARPYKHLEDNSKVWEEVSHGYSLEADLPRDTPSFLAKITVSCWRFHGCQRPYFPQIIAALLPNASPCFLQHFRMISFYHSLEGQEYKQLVEAIQDNEDENITTPLSTPSPPPTNLKGPPLPPRPATGLKWRPSFRLRCQTSPRNTKQSFSFNADVLQELSLNQHNDMDTNTRGTTSQEHHAKSSSPNSVTSNNTSSTESSSNLILSAIKNSDFHPQSLENRRNNVMRDRDQEESQAETLTNLAPAPSNLVVHIKKQGFSSTTISTSTVASDIGKFPALSFPALNCSKASKSYCNSH